MSSNFSLKSGVMDARRVMRHGVKMGLGTDVAGGYSVSILDAIRQTIIAAQVALWRDQGTGTMCGDGGPTDKRLPAAAPAGDAKAEEEEKKEPADIGIAQAFYFATLGGAHVCGLGNEVGNFAVGKSFDALIVDPSPTQRHEVYPPLQKPGHNTPKRARNRATAAADAATAAAAGENENDALDAAAGSTDAVPTATSSATRPTSADDAERKGGHHFCYDGDTIMDRFSKFVFTGDDRNIVAVYVDGREIKGAYYQRNWVDIKTSE
jgi:hypothetical protein